LRINNIRVIRRVCQVVAKFLGKYSHLEESAIAHVVPSTVLLTAIHYRALPDGHRFLISRHITLWSICFLQNMLQTMK